MNHALDFDGRVIASALDLLQEGLHHCPAHPDRRPSLSVRRAADGRWLLHCFAGCDTETILAAAGLTFADLAPPGAASTPRKPLARIHWREELERPLIARARRAFRRLLPYLELFPIFDHIRERRRAIHRLRRLASSWGDVGAAWDVLAAAADDERENNVLEMEVDAVMGAIRR